MCIRNIHTYVYVYVVYVRRHRRLYKSTLSHYRYTEDQRTTTTPRETRLQRYGKDTFGPIGAQGFTYCEGQEARPKDDDHTPRDETAKIRQRYVGADRGPRVYLLRGIGALRIVQRHGVDGHWNFV